MFFKIFFVFQKDLWLDYILIMLYINMFPDHQRMIEIVLEHLNQVIIINRFGCFFFFIFFFSNKDPFFQKFKTKYEQKIETLPSADVQLDQRDANKPDNSSEQVCFFQVSFFHLIKYLKLYLFRLLHHLLQLL